MQKKIVALAVAGLSTAAFAQTNVTIYGVADVSAMGYSLSTSKSAGNTSGGVNEAANGNAMGLQSNSSLLGFKGTEDLGNGLKAMFQAETNMNFTGQPSGLQVNSGSLFGTSAMRDTFIGLSNKYGTAMAGYLSTPFRSTLMSFDVMPGGTNVSQMDAFLGTMRFGSAGIGRQGTGAIQAGSAVRATAVAYAMPTLYGFNASIAFTGMGNNGTTNHTATTGDCGNASACVITPQSAWGFNLGWTGYGVNIAGAFQQANLNPTYTAAAGATDAATAANQAVGNAIMGQIGDYTSYLVGAAYTGVQNLKVSATYVRNSLGTSASGANVLTNGAGKISNNQAQVGASYRMGNWEPRVSAYWLSDNDGANSIGQQNGARMWTANVGYYLSKRTQVYGLISNLNNSANQNYSFANMTESNMKPTGGQNLFGYGVGMRTTF